MAKVLKQTFEDWKKAIDRILSQTIGMVSDDLPDCEYRVWYDSGLPPSRAAARVITRAREF